MSKEQGLVSGANDKDGVAYWLVPVKPHGDKTAEDVIFDLVVRRHVFAFRRRRSLRPGDWVCFYVSRRGVVCFAKVASKIENLTHPSVPPEYPWLFRLENAHAYVDNPKEIDLAVRQELDAFRGRDLTKQWAWFVQTSTRISEHDFRLLTRRKG